MVSDVSTKHSVESIQVSFNALERMTHAEGLVFSYKCWKDGNPLICVSSDQESTRLNSDYFMVVLNADQWSNRRIRLEITGHKRAAKKKAVSPWKVVRAKLLTRSRFTLGIPYQISPHT